VYEVRPHGSMELDPVDRRAWAYRTREPMRVVREVPHAEIDDEWMAEQARRRAAQREAGT